MQLDAFSPNTPQTGHADSNGAATKRCGRCGETKPLDAFQRDPRRPDGKRRECAACNTATLRTWYAHPENRARVAAQIKRWQAENPEKVRAYRAVRRALASGHLTRGPCEVGGDCAGRIEAHHDDYSRPLAVRWLCRKHHEAHHHSEAA